ncbi:hypothetical protein D3C87_259810 [compost metagenome]
MTIGSMAFAILTFSFSALAAPLELNQALKQAFEDHVDAICFVQENKELNDTRYFSIQCENSMSLNNYEVNVQLGKVRGEGSVGTKSGYVYGYCNVQGAVAKNGMVAIESNCFNHGN